MTEKLTERRMFLPVDIAHNDGDFESYLHGELSITNDAKGRIYIDVGDGVHCVGINLPDLMRFIQNEMLRAGKP